MKNTTKCNISGPCVDLEHVALLKSYFKNYISFVQGQAEQQDNLDAHMGTHLYSTVLKYKSCCLCLLYVVFDLCACTIISFTVLMSHIYFRLSQGPLVKRDMVNTWQFFFSSFFSHLMDREVL